MFFEWVLSRLPAPVRGERAASLVRVFSRHLDTLASRARAAAKIDLPGEAPDDALLRVGRDRVIERMPGEPLDGYRTRLSAAWDAWGLACTRRGVATPLVLAGLGAPTLVTQREVHLAPHRTETWARFCILFRGLVAWDAGLRWDADFVWDARHPDPIEALAADAARQQLRLLVAPWKSARDRVTCAIVARGAWLWDDGRAWDHPGTLWDGGVVTTIGQPAWDTAAMAWDSGWSWDCLL